MEQISADKVKIPIRDQLKGLLTKDLSTKRQLTIEITNTEVRGLIISSKSGVINVEEAFHMQEQDILNTSQTTLSEQVIATIKEKVAYHKTARSGIVISLPSLGGVSKVVKLPPLDNKTLQDMIQEDYKKFFTNLLEETIKGTEKLGDRGKKQGEIYYLLSTMPKLPIISLSTQIDKRKVRIDSIYNEVLALRNVLSLVAKDKQTKCLIVLRPDKIQLIVMNNNTLVFHKILDLTKEDIVNDDLSMGYTDSWSVKKKENAEETLNNERVSRLYSTLSWVSNTLDYINQKKNVVITEVLLAGEYIKIPTAKSLMTEELGIDVFDLNICNTEDTKQEVLNWTYDSLEDDYLIPFGLSLRGVVT